MKTGAIKVLLVVACFAATAGCHKQVAAIHPPPAPAAAKAVVPARDQPQPVATPVAESRSPTAPDALTKERIQDLLNRIQDVYFDYDKPTLRPDAVATLQKDATALTEILRQYPTYKLTVQGYCDERGSDEYNLALGDARAKRAEEFLVNLGLPAAQLRTVSYGKERPICTEHNEACWQRNRRAHVTQDQPS